MKSQSRLFLSFCASLLIFSSAAYAAEDGQLLTLAAALKLAGADSTDVQLAYEQSLEARARYQQARQKFLPWLSPGLGYRRIDGRAQETAGNILEVDKQSYGLALTLAADIELGEAIYGSLITRRRLQAADQQTAVAHQQASFETRRAYFSLVDAQAAKAVAQQAQTLAEHYAAQVKDAVEAGVAFAGDASRAKTQAQRRQLQVAETDVAILVAAAQLAEILRLQHGTTLRASDAELQPMVFIDVTIPVVDLVAKALALRPELQVQASLQLAADAEVDQAKNGQLIPRILLRGSYGGLGGGSGGDWGNFGPSSEVALGVEWRIGPGGLFDGPRRDIASSNVRQLQIQDQRLRERITREVQVAYAESVSAIEQVRLAQNVLATSEETLRLTKERRQFGVGAVLEAISAEEELTAARLAFVRAVTRHNLAQAGLLFAVGKRAE